MKSECSHQALCWLVTWTNRCFLYVSNHYRFQIEIIIFFIFVSELYNRLAGHGRAGLVKNAFGPRAVFPLDFSSYGRSGLKKSWTVPSPVWMSDCKLHRVNFTERQVNRYRALSFVSEKKAKNIGNQVDWRRTTAAGRTQIFTQYNSDARASFEVESCSVLHPFRLCLSDVVMVDSCAFSAAWRSKYRQASLGFRTSSSAPPAPGRRAGSPTYCTLLTWIGEDTSPLTRSLLILRPIWDCSFAEQR